MSRKYHSLCCPGFSPHKLISSVANSSSTHFGYGTNEGGANEKEINSNLILQTRLDVGLNL